MQWAVPEVIICPTEEICLLLTVKAGILVM